MCKIILFRIINAQNQIAKLFTVPWNTFYYEELEPVELPNTKTSTTFLKIGKHLGKEKVNLSDLTSECFFSELRACFASDFPKILINIFSAFFLEKHEHYIIKLTCYYILCLLCHESYPSDFLILLPYMAESSLSSDRAIWHNKKTTVQCRQTKHLSRFILWGDLIVKLFNKIVLLVKNKHDAGKIKMMNRLWIK